MSGDLFGYPLALNHFHQIDAGRQNLLILRSLSRLENGLPILRVLLSAKDPVKVPD